MACWWKHCIVKPEAKGLTPGCDRVEDRFIFHFFQVNTFADSSVPVLPLCNNDNNNNNNNGGELQLVFCRQFFDIWCTTDLSSACNFSKYKTDLSSANSSSRHTKVAKLGLFKLCASLTSWLFPLYFFFFFFWWVDGGGSAMSICSMNIFVLYTSSP